MILAAHMETTQKDARRSLQVATRWHIMAIQD